MNWELLLDSLVPHLDVFLAAIWSVFCVWTGSKMVRTMPGPARERAPFVPEYQPGTVEIDKTHDDPWEEAMNPHPPERITGDMQ